MSSEGIFSSAKILIIDDELANVRFVAMLLEQIGYQPPAFTIDSREAVSRFLELQPDLILLDLHMPQPTGFELLAQFRKIIGSETYLPILVLTADVTSDAKLRALRGGATEFLTKPLDAAEVVLRVQNLLRTRQLYLEMQRHNQRLEEMVYQRTEALEESRHAALERLALAAEYRDDDTGQHTKRVGQLAALLAAILDLPESVVTAMRRAATLHDIGKIGIPDQVLLKPGKLTPEEFAIVKTHTVIGGHILGGSEIPLLQLAEEIALTHHERWDGSGYPRGLRGEAIPISGRIVAVVDVFDSLTHARPYKPAWPQADALAEIDAQAGRQFDPQVVRAFRELVAMGVHLAPQVPLPLQDAPAAISPPPQGRELDYEPLTPRELEILRCIAQGRTNRDIAQSLFISISTVKVHVERIIAKLSANDRTQAAIRAVKFGLLDPDQLDAEE